MEYGNKSHNYIFSLMVFETPKTTPKKKKKKNVHV